MGIEFSIIEKVELILNLYTSPKGYLAESIDDFPEMKKFINAGYADLNKDNNIYYANQQGLDFLHLTIKKISEDLIAFMKRNNWNVLQNDLIAWFKNSYELDDDFLERELARYIIDNLPHYNYQIYFSHVKGKYILEKQTY